MLSLEKELVLFSGGLEISNSQYIIKNTNKIFYR